MQLLIIFLGLIAHFDIPGRERAVLVSEPHHKSVMAISISDLKDPAHVTNFAGGRIVTDDDGNQWGEWNLQGTHLVFQNLPGGSTKVDPNIPSLTQITDGSRPLTKILNGTLHPRTSALVDYTGGELMSASPFSCPVRWTPPRPPAGGVLPNATFHTGFATGIVGYMGETSAASPPFILNGIERLDLLPNATVFIGNLSMPGYPGPHHKDYLWLLDDGSYICEMQGTCPFPPDKKAPVFGSPKFLSARVAAVQLPSNFRILDVGNPECSNSRFP